MPFPPNSSSCPKKLSSEYQLYACGNFFRHSSILEKIAILGQPPRNTGWACFSKKGDAMPIYEFKCNHCGDVFEHLIFSSDGDETACPTCGGEDTCRLMSSFSSISSKFSECPSDGMSAACPPSCSPATSGFS